MRKSLTPGQICLSVEKIYLTIDENLKKVFTVGNPFSLYYWFIRRAANEANEQSENAYFEVRLLKKVRDWINKWRQKE